MDHAHNAHAISKRRQVHKNASEQLNPRQLNLIFLLIVILCTRYITPKAKNTVKTKLKAKTLKQLIVMRMMYKTATEDEERVLRGG